MKKMIKAFGLIFCAVIGTTAFAVTIPSFTVTTSYSNRDIGSNTYGLVKTAYYTASISSVSGSSPKYNVKAAENLSGIGVSLGTQTVASTTGNLSIRKAFTKNAGFQGTMHFYVTGVSGSITNSVTLS